MLNRFFKLAVWSALLLVGQSLSASVFFINSQHELQVALAATVATGKTLVLDFFSTQCVPCQMLHGVLDTVASQTQGRADFAFVNVEIAQELSQNYGISSLPTLLFFKNGVEVRRMVGLQNEQTISQAISGF